MRGGGTEVLGLVPSQIGVCLPWCFRNSKWRNTLSQKLEVGKQHYLAYCALLPLLGHILARSVHAAGKHSLTASSVCTAGEFLKKRYLLTYKYRENNMLYETTVRLH